MSPQRGQGAHTVSAATLGRDRPKGTETHDNITRTHHHHGKNHHCTLLADSRSASRRPLAGAGTAHADPSRSKRV